MLALFALYERLRAHGGMLILAASTSPAAIGLKLADLATRLTAGLVYQLQPLTDAEKIAALRLRAQRRGLEMTEEVANYLLTRFSRDMPSLFALPDKLDTATLAAQRRADHSVPARVGVSLVGWSPAQPCSPHTTRSSGTGIPMPLNASSFLVGQGSTLYSCAPAARAART